MTRRRAKAINFGIIYGISGFGLARQLGITPGEARTYIDAYFVRYPGIRTYMERTKDEARINGYVSTAFGRRCWVPGIADKNPARRAYAERQAINAPLQGGAADIIKRAMVRLPKALADAGLKSRLLLQVHDELLFEAPEGEVPALTALAKRVMESAAVLAVPLVVETGSGRDLGRRALTVRDDAGQLPVIAKFPVIASGAKQSRPGMSTGLGAVHTAFRMQQSVGTAAIFAVEAASGGAYIARGCP